MFAILLSFAPAYYVAISCNCADFLCRECRSTIRVTSQGGFAVGLVNNLFDYEPNAVRDLRFEEISPEVTSPGP